MIGRSLAVFFAALAVLGALMISAGAKETTFKQPKVNGNRLDWCFTFQHDCGAPAANAWCAAQGFQSASKFSKASNVGVTRTIGDKSLCADTNCDSFSQITCFSAAQASYDQPVFKGMRLDWCYAWAKQCGKPAADAFCKSKGHSGVASFQKEAKVGMTRLISNSQVCDGNCDSFSNIVCQ